jgi:hypothetical protein
VVGVSDEISVAERVARELRENPDAGVPEIAGALNVAPDEVADVLDEDTPDSELELNSSTEDRVRRSREGPRTDPGPRPPNGDGGAAFDFERLRYIQLRGDGSKLPAKAWGGYDQDFDEAAHVHDHGDVQLHPADNWGVVDVEDPDHGSFALLIFDVDVHKAPEDFDPDRLQVPGDTLVTRSQNGGFHVYFVLNGYERGDLQESDFQMTADPGFDVDIRGSVVSHHVVAPNDIPGVGGDYEVVNDTEISAVLEPSDAAGRITLDGEPLLQFDPDGGVGDYDFDVPGEPPAEMPTCYHAGLELRKAAPDDHPNTHKVNVLTAACGLAAGYGPEEVASHFCGEWAPTDGDVDVSDKETTEYQVQHIADGEYHPPAESTLRDYGILDEGEHCEGCPIEYHGSPDGSTTSHSTTEDTTAGGPPDPETCAPPAVEFHDFDREERWDALQGERYDDYISHTGPVVWADHAGAGKTTNAGRAAAERDRAFVALFDKHEKAREFVCDDATPDVDLHLKGSEQKRHDVCMDAEPTDEPCPEHPGGDCPHMCPMYDLGKDDEARQQYEAVVKEVGPVKAHMYLDLPLHDEDNMCRWYQQFDDVESADRIVGVHEYQTLKTVRKGRDVIVDESPSSLKTERDIDIEGVARAATALDAIADVPGTPETLEEFARFARAILDGLAGDDTADGLADLTAPDVSEYAETVLEPVDPDDLPDDVDAEDVEKRKVREDVGMPEENDRTRTEWVVERPLVDEAFAQAKLAYNETVINRMRRDEWDGAPLCFDALLAAAAEAGADAEAARKAIAVPTVLETCPWCGSDLAHDEGARVCTDEDCDWHEEYQRLTKKDGETARASARLDTDDGSQDALAYRALPLASDLPSSPLVLDATATPAKVAALYDVSEDQVTVAGDEYLDSNLHVTQVVDGQYHRGTVEGALEDDATLAERMQRAIDTAGDVHECPLYIGPKKLLAAFDFPEHGETLHYHAARGLNRAECDAVMCIGAPHADVEDLRRDAELYAQGDVDVRVGGAEYSTRREAGAPVWRTLLFEDDAGDGRAIPTKDFSGLVGDLWRETREKELVQAVHRIRPLLADDTKHAYLLTNVPTEIPVDELATFEELADPLEAMLPVPERAIALLEAVDDVVAGDGPDGFRASQLVEQRDDGTIANKVAGYHRLARLSGLGVSRRTVYEWVHDLEGVGLLQPEKYEQHAGVSYAVDPATLNSALSVLSSNGGFKVAARRRLRSILADSASGLDWLAWARDVFDLRGDPERGGPPPSGGGAGA